MGTHQADESGVSSILVAVEKRDVKQAAKLFARGMGRGVRAAGRGHSPVGQVGSGKVLRPTYSATGGTRAERAGVHAGVTAGNAPLLAIGAAGGAAADRKLHKAARDAGAEGAAAGGAVLAGGGAAAQFRRARTARKDSDSHAARAEEHNNLLAERLNRHGHGGKGTLPPTRPSIAQTRAVHQAARNSSVQAAESARTAFRAARRGKGLAGVAAGLGAGAVALHHRAQPKPVKAYSYR